MTLQSSGPISLANVQTEFGGSNPISLSEYYGAASGIPSSGTISLSNFYGKSSYTPPSEVKRQFFSDVSGSINTWSVGWSTSGLQSGDLFIFFATKFRRGSGGATQLYSNWSTLNSANYTDTGSYFVGYGSASVFYTTSFTGGITIYNSGGSTSEAAIGCLTVWRNASIQQSNAGVVTGAPAGLSAAVNGRYLFYQAGHGSWTYGYEGGQIASQRAYGNYASLSNYSNAYGAASSNGVPDPFCGFGYNVYSSTSTPSYWGGGLSSYINALSVRL